MSPCRPDLLPCEAAAVEVTRPRVLWIYRRPVWPSSPFLLLISLSLFV